MTWTELWNRVLYFYGIRHVRWVYWSYRLTRRVTFWQDGAHLHVALGDLEFLDDVWEGRS